MKVTFEEDYSRYSETQLEHHENTEERNEVDDGTLIHDDVGPDFGSEDLNEIEAPPVPKENSNIEREVNDLIISG